MHNYIGCMCLTFLHCVFLNVTSNCLPNRKQSHTDYICLTFLRCVFSCAASKRLGQNMHNHIGCICLASLHCVFSNVFSKQLSSNIYCFWNKLKLSKLLKSKVGHNNGTDITNINNANLDTLVLNIATLFKLFFHHHYQYLCSNKCFFSAWVHVGRFIYTHRTGSKLRKCLFLASRLVSWVLYKIASPNFPLMLLICGWALHVFLTREGDCCAAFDFDKKKGDMSMIVPWSSWNVKIA